MNVTELGYVIRHWRIVKNETLGTMAKALGMETSRLSGIETRDIEPTEEELRHIAYYMAGLSKQKIMAAEMEHKKLDVFWNKIRAGLGAKLLEELRKR